MVCITGAERICPSKKDKQRGGKEEWGRVEKKGGQRPELICFFFFERGGEKRGDNADGSGFFLRGRIILTRQEV